MAMIKAGLAGAALGALTLGTALFVAPIAAQAPGAPTDRSRAAQVPDTRSPGPGSNRETSPGTSPRRGADDDDVDITGPRGDVGVCQDRLVRAAQARLERIQRLIRLTDEQRPAFDELKMASRKAVDVLRAACEIERPFTPTARMAAAEKRLEARLQALRILRPALESFYKQLTDEQKIRWVLGSQPDHRWGGAAPDRWQSWRQPGRQGDEGSRRFDDERADRWQRDRPGPGENRRGWQDEFRGDEDRLDRSWRRWRDRFGGDGGDEPERWGRRWREQDRDGFGERRWRDSDSDEWREQRRRDESGRSTGPNEERL